MTKDLKRELNRILNRHYLLLTREMIRQLDSANTNNEIVDILDSFKEELVNCNKVAEELRKENAE